MSDTRPTQGDWEYTAYNAEPETPCAVTVFRGDGETDVAVCYFASTSDDPLIGDELPDRPEMIANAHLIVAAPELLAACEAAEEALAGIVNDWESVTPDEQQALQQLRDAIAKAKGRQ